MDGATVNGQQIKVNEVSVLLSVAPLPHHFFLCFRLALVVMGAAVAVEDMEAAVVAAVMEVVAMVVAAVVADTEVR